MLDWLASPDLRQQCQAGLNKNEQRHALAQVICTFKQGRIANRGQEAQQFRASGLNLVIAAIACTGTRPTLQMRSPICTVRVGKHPTRGSPTRHRSPGSTSVSRVISCGIALPQPLDAADRSTSDDPRSPHEVRSRKVHRLRCLSNNRRSALFDEAADQAVSNTIMIEDRMPWDDSGNRSNDIATAIITNNPAVVAAIKQDDINFDQNTVSWRDKIRAKNLAKSKSAKIA